MVFTLLGNSGEGYQRQTPGMLQAMLELADNESFSFAELTTSPDMELSTWMRYICSLSQPGQLWMIIHSLLRKKLWLRSLL